jgi:hypothetical protein
MKNLKAVLTIGGALILATMALSGSAHACGGDKEAKVMKDGDRTVQSEKSDEMKVAMKDQVYGPPAPQWTEVTQEVSESGSR